MTEHCHSQNRHTRSAAKIQQLINIFIVDSVPDYHFLQRFHGNAQTVGVLAFLRGWLIIHNVRINPHHFPQDLFHTSPASLSSPLALHRPQLPVLLYLGPSTVPYGYPSTRYLQQPFHNFPTLAAKGEIEFQRFTRQFRFQLTSRS